MKTKLCSFSGGRIYPGHGKQLVRIDSKTFIFGSKKASEYTKQRKNNRQFAWTSFYRLDKKKGITEEASKKRSRRLVKTQRGIVGASVEMIKARRDESKKIREAVTIQKPAVKTEEAPKDKKAEKQKRRAEKAKLSGTSNAQTQKTARMLLQKSAGGRPKIQATSR